MPESWIMIAIGLALIAASVLARGLSYGMAPHHQKPKYPATPQLRIVLFSFGLLSLVLGLLGVIRR